MSPFDGRRVSGVPARGRQCPPMRGHAGRTRDAASASPFRNATTCRSPWACTGCGDGCGAARAGNARPSTPSWNLTSGRKGNARTGEGLGSRGRANRARRIAAAAGDQARPPAGSVRVEEVLEVVVLTAPADHEADDLRDLLRREPDRPADQAVHAGAGRDGSGATAPPGHALPTNSAARDLFNRVRTLIAMPMRDSTATRSTPPGRNVASSRSGAMVPTIAPCGRGASRRAARCLPITLSGLFIAVSHARRSGHRLDRASAPTVWQANARSPQGPAAVARSFHLAITPATMRSQRAPSKEKASARA